MASVAGQTVKNPPVMQETQVQSLGRKDPLRRKWQPTPVLLPGEFHGQRSLADYSPWHHKELDMTVQLSLIFGIYKDGTDELICKEEIEIQV